MEKLKSIFLLGVGRNTPVFMDLAEQCGYRIEGLYHFDDSKTGHYEHGCEIIGSFDDLYNEGDLSDTNFLLTMGDNQIRCGIAEKIRSINGNLPSLIHPTAIVSKFASIQDGVIIGPFTYIQADTFVHKDTIILSHVNISHGNKIGKGCFIAGGAIIGAYTNIGDMVFIGQGVLTISEKVSKIGNDAFIGAGSLVTKPIEAGKKVKGRPAKPI